MEDFWIFVYILGGALVIVVINLRVFVIFQKSKKKIEKQEQEAREKLYEIAILKELGERIGYSLDLERIIKIVAGSLRQFVDYSVAAYMLINGSRVIFNVEIFGSVNRSFIDDLKNRMRKSLESKIGHVLEKAQVIEALSGAILVDELNTDIKSYFELPFTIKEKIKGIIAVSSTKPNLYNQESMKILAKILNQTEYAVNRFEQALDLEKGKISSMIESMMDGVIMTDMESRIVVANPVSKAVIGINKENEVSIFDFIENLGGGFDIRGRLEEAILLKKDIVISEVWINDHCYHVFVSPVRNIFNQEEILGGVVLFHDITQEKELEKLREDFTSMMVHDLRSPLDGITKMISVIQNETDEMLSSKYLGMINKATKEMLELVNSLLDMAKLESGKFEIFLEEEDLKVLIEEKIAYYAPSAQEKKINLNSFVSPSIPTRFKFDSVRIGRVLNNLISNALKFVDEEGKIIINAFYHKQDGPIFKEAQDSKVSWYLKKDEQKLLDIPEGIIVAVTDSGRGIKQQDLKRIFERFRQSSDKNKMAAQHGTGLGLCVSRGIIEAHGGVLEVASMVGEGSTFWFSLPKRELK